MPFSLIATCSPSNEYETVLHPDSLIVVELELGQENHKFPLARVVYCPPSAIHLAEKTFHPYMNARIELEDWWQLMWWTKDFYTAQLLAVAGSKVAIRRSRGDRAVRSPRYTLNPNG